MVKQMSYPVSYLVMIERYIRERNSRDPEKYRANSECFTYKGLRWWLMHHGDYRDLEWHTVERVIRELVRDGYLWRIDSRRSVLFCLNDRSRELIENYRKQVQNQG